MWQSIERYIIYTTKSLQFQLETWKKKREIAKAYQSQNVLVSLKQYTLPTGIIGGVIIGGFLIYIATSSFFSYIKSVQPIRQASLEKKHIKQSPSFAQNQLKERPAIPVDSTQDLISDRKSSYKPIGYAIVANKASKHLYLLKQRKDLKWKTIQKYFMAIGEKKGRKERAGDKKTPEGTYFITGRKETNELTPIYGPVAYVLNYPNEDDLKAGRSGEGIWIHGTHPDSFPLQTRGCLELYNHNLKELSSYIDLGIGTPVIIVDQQNIENPDDAIRQPEIYTQRNRFLNEHTKRQDDFIQLLNSWKTAWESKDIEEYAKFYHAQTFYSQGLKWNAWKEKKMRTFEIYSFISLGLNNVILTDFSESTAVIKFIQTYKSDALNVQNGKKLSFIKNNGAWQINRESTFPKEEHIL